MTTERRRVVDPVAFEAAAVASAVEHAGNIKKKMGPSLQDIDAAVEAPQSTTGTLNEDGMVEAAKAVERQRVGKS